MCYYVWFLRDSRVQLSMVRKCWRTHQAARKAALIGYTKLEEQGVTQRVVMQCLDGCLCEKFQKGCSSR